MIILVKVIGKKNVIGCYDCGREYDKNGVVYG